MGWQKVVKVIGGMCYAVPTAILPTLIVRAFFPKLTFAAVVAVFGAWWFLFAIGWALIFFTRPDLVAHLPPSRMELRRRKKSFYDSLPGGPHGQ
jgi:hypothetical protein